MGPLEQASPDTAPAGLVESVKQEIRDALANMASMPGFAPRRSQRLMIAEIAKTLAGEYPGLERVICVEGPTGTGKSLGYLLSAVPVAKALGLKLVISTATVALQEQLITKDIPSVHERSGLKFTYGLAKGRRRYVCDRNLDQLAGGGQVDLELDLEHAEDYASLATWGTKPTDEDLRTVEAMRDARSAGTWNGDLDEWERPIRDSLKEVITTDKAGCTASTCPFKDRCAFLQVSNERKSRDVIVANHALVMADLMLGGGVVLPPPEETIYVFDEGHHLASVAIDQGTAKTQLVSPLGRFSQLLSLPQAIRTSVPEKPSLHEALDEIEARLKIEVKALKDRLEELHVAIKSVHPAVEAAKLVIDSKRDRDEQDPEAQIWRFPLGVVPEDLRKLFGTAANQVNIVYQFTMKIVDRVKNALSEGDGNIVTNMALSTAQSIADRLDTMGMTFRHFAAAPPEDLKVPPVARWIECIGGGKDFECCASPTSAAALLRHVLWEKCRGAVVTSATLTALNRFDRLFEETGLGLQYGTRAVKLDSPFDYRRNAELVIPAMSSNPKNAEAHTDEIIELCNRGLINPDEGTLVLFASYKQMRAVAEGLDSHLASRVLMQGSAPRQELLATHRARIEAGGGSILFGVASFAEGLDLPGKLCTHVIIAKLFFTVPDSPVELTRSEWLESLGRNPFIEISVPDASFKLIQAVGRLLRTETDTGRVTLLDRRLVDKAYGRRMLDALPPFTRRIDRGKRAAA